MTDIDDAGRQVVQVVGQLFRVLRDERSGGMSATAVATLRRLSLDGPHRVSDLAAAESASQPAMTQLVRRLETAGLIRRRAVQGDGRGVLVEITPDGLELLDHRVAEQAATVASLIAALGSADREQLLAALPALARLGEVAAEHRAARLAGKPAS